MNAKQIEEAIVSYVRRSMSPQDREDFLTSISQSDQSGKTEIINCFFIVVRHYELVEGKKFDKKLKLDFFDILLANFRVEFRKEIDDLPIAFAV